MVTENLVKSLLSWQGGKSQLIKTIVPRIPQHDCYVECFAGAAWVLFAKPQSKVEILNDINSELTTLYRVVKYHLEEFVRYFKWILVARDQFDDFKKMDVDTMTDIQRAVRFFYLIRLNYGSKLDFGSFSLSSYRPLRINLLRLEEDLSEAHLRLSNVGVENKPYEYLINRYDHHSTFFYLDPPYWNCESDYGKGIFEKADFSKLNQLLKGIAGKFMMSINDAPEIRKTFAGFFIEPVKTKYSLSSKNPTYVTELLITNYSPQT